MANSRTRNATRNMMFGTLLKIYQMIVPFLMRTVMIYFMGVQYVGLNSLFTSILQVLNLAELGVGSAMVYSMYKPIAWLLVSVAASERELSSWSRWMLLIISSWIDFKYIDAYIILITYILRKMGETKTACKQFVSSFVECTDLLRTQISPNICNQILGTQQRAHLNQLQNFISNS